MSYRNINLLRNKQVKVSNKLIMFSSNFKSVFYICWAQKSNYSRKLAYFKCFVIELWAIFYFTHHKSAEHFPALLNKRRKKCLKGLSTFSIQYIESKSAKPFICILISSTEKCWALFEVVLSTFSFRYIESKSAKPFI